MRPPLIEMRMQGSGAPNTGIGPEAPAPYVVFPTSPMREPPTRTTTKALTPPPRITLQDELFSNYLMQLHLQFQYPR